MWLVKIFGGVNLSYKCLVPALDSQKCIRDLFLSLSLLQIRRPALQSVLQDQAKRHGHEDPRVRRDETRREAELMLRRWERRNFFFWGGVGGWGVQRGWV